MQAVAADDLVLPRRSRRPSERVRHQQAVLRVDPAVMAAARKAAGGDMSRLVIISATEVLVR